MFVCKNNKYFSIYRAVNQLVCQFYLVVSKQYIDFINDKNAARERIIFVMEVACKRSYEYVLTTIDQ